MCEWFNKRRIILVLMAGALTVGTLKLLLVGAYCLVPGAYLAPNELVTAETSIHGLVLYRDTGTHHVSMYDQATWWYEAMLFGVWATSIGTGTLTYVVADRLWRD